MVPMSVVQDKKGCTSDPDFLSSGNVQRPFPLSPAVRCAPFYQCHKAMESADGLDAHINCDRYTYNQL